MTGTHPANTASFKRGVHGAKPPMIGQYFAAAMVALYIERELYGITTMSG